MGMPDFHETVGICVDRITSMRAEAIELQEIVDGKKTPILAQFKKNSRDGYSELEQIYGLTPQFNDRWKAAFIELAQKRIDEIVAIIGEVNRSVHGIPNVPEGQH